MSEQGKNSQNELDVTLNYVSKGYQKQISQVQGLKDLFDQMKKDLGPITLPAIKGLKGALRDARELRDVTSLLTRTGAVDSVPQGLSKEQRRAAKARQIQDVSLKQANLDVQDRTLKTQRQLANQTDKELQNRAFLGNLTKKQIEEHSKSLDSLKAMAKGYDEANKAGIKVQPLLQGKVNKLIEAEITQRKEAAQALRTADLRARLEANNVAKMYARQSLEGKNTGLTAYLKTANLDQVKALESAMRTESLKKGYTPTAESDTFNKKVAKAREDIVAPTVNLKPQDIVDKIKTGVFTQADVNHAVTQIRKQLTHATKTGVDRDTLVGLHQGLLDIRKAGAEKFTPVSPYQQAKTAEETHAKKLLGARLDAQSLQTATKAQIEEQLKASKIMSHPTKAAFGSDAYKQEKGYQDLLKNRLQILKQLEAEEKKKEALAKVRADNSVRKIKTEIAATEDLGKLKSLQRQLNARLQAEVKADPKSTLVTELEQRKAALANKIKNLNTPKEILELTRQSQDLKVSNADTIAKNRVTAAEKAAQTALNNEAKARAITDGRFKTEQQLADLKAHELKFAKDTLNFGIQTGRLKGQELLDAEKHLKVIQDRERVQQKLTQSNANIANIANTGKYRTESDIKGIKDKAEAEIARKVIAHRMRLEQMDEAELKRQQKLLDMAKSRDHLLTAQANRQDKERQNERRLSTITNLEGDGGASMAIVQAGFMMRSQLLGGLSSIFSGAFDSAVQLDKAFRNLQAISASTNYEMATMKVNLINVAQASKFSASEVGETAVMLAQAGLSIQEIGASMKGIITLAQATGTDLAKSVDVVTSVLSIFNKSATETDTIVNQLTAALNESKLDINKMALGLQYAGNIASDSGVSFEELTAALGATANAGIRSGSTLGTGLRQMFIDLQKPNEKLTKRLETLGITLDQVSFRSQGLEGVLRNLRNAGFSSADAFETFEVRSAAAFSALSGNLTDFHDLQEELADTDAAFEANNVQMESFAVQLDHLKSNLGVLAAEGLKPTLSMLRDMTKGMAHAMENTEEGVGWVQGLTSAFTALTVGVTLIWFSRLVGGLLATAKAFAFVGNSLTLTRYGFIGLFGVLGTLFLQWQSHTKEIERLNTALDKAKGKYNDLKAELQSQENTINNVDEAVKSLVDRYGVLKNDSSQTALVTRTLQDQFAQFGLELDDVADNKIENVIAKVRQLRGELAKQLKETIIKEANAKIDAANLTKLASQENLKNPSLTSDTLGFNRKSFETFLRYTNVPRNKLVMFPNPLTGNHQLTDGSGYVTPQQKAIAAHPEIRKLFIELFSGGVRTTQKGTLLPASEFNPENILLQLSKKIYEVKDPEQNRLLTEASTSFSKAIEDLKVVLKSDKTVENIGKKADKAVRNVTREEMFNEVTAIGGASELQMQSFKTELDSISKTKGLSIKELRKRQSNLAKEVNKWFEVNIPKAEDYISKLPEEDKAKFTELMQAVKERQGEVRKILIDTDKEFAKEQMLLLNTRIQAAEEDLKLAEKLQADSTGTDTLTKRAEVTKKKQKYLNDLRREKKKLEAKDGENSLLIMGAFEQELKIEADSKARDLAAQEKAIKDKAKDAGNNSLNAAARADLEAKKKALEDFYDKVKNDEKTLETNQAAERFQATAKTYRPLTTGNMFDQLSDENKKAAQAKANATGVSQEYSILGSTKATFARQAARFDNESLQKKQVQEKLALETSILFDLQQRKQNLNVEAYNKLLADQVTLQATVTRLNGIAQDARSDKDDKALQLAQEALERNKEAREAHEAEEERLTQDIDTRNNSIENLKNNLQALIDKYDLLDTTMASGVQSMTSGLSSIFTDWASGVIKNTDDVKEAFRSLGQSVLQSMAKVVSDRIAQQFMGFILNGLGSMFGGSSPSSLPVEAGARLASTGGLITTSGVKHFARGGEVTGTNIGRDSVPALLQPNEYVVQRSAVQALGTNFMQNLNNVTTGSLKQGAANLGGSKPMVQNVMKSSPPVNVYVVSPEQQRQMSQQDVVVALQDDILRGGATKKLIKAVITGEI